MAYASEPKLSISAQYFWSDLQLTLLVDLLKEKLLPLMGEQCKFRVAVTVKGPPEFTRTYTDVDQFGATINEDQDIVNVDLNRNDYTLSISLTITTKSKRIDVRIGSDAALAQKAQESLADIQTVLKLLLLPEKNVREEVKFRSTYRKKKPESRDWILQAIALFESHVVAADYFNAEYHLLSAPQYRYECNNTEKLKLSLTNQWKEIAAVQFSVSNRSKFASLNCAFDRSEVILDTEGESKEQIESFALEIEQKLALQPIKEEQRYQFDGTRRNYFAKETIGKDWFQQILQTVNSFFSSKHFFNGGLNFIATEGDTTYGNQDTWHQALLQNWEQVDAAYFSIGGDESTVSVNTDLRRELLRMEVKARSWELIDQIFKSLEDSYGLERIKGRPYRYRRFSRFYKITDRLDFQDFAAAIEQAVQIGFPQKYVVQDAYVEEEKDTRSLQSFFTLSDFLTTLRSNPGKKYQTIYIFLQGPKESSLSIKADLEDMKLEMRTSFKRTEFNKIIDVVEDKIDLKLVEEKKSETKEKGSDKEKSIWSKIVLPLFGLILSGSAIIVISESFPRYSLQMNRPAINEKDELLTLPSGKAFLNWTLQKKQFWHEVKESSPTLIRIYNEEQIPIKTITSSKDSITLPLDAGTYDIELINKLTANRPHVRVFVPKSQNNTPVTSK